MTVHTLPRQRRYPQQPTAVVQTHINWLLAAGMTRQAISDDTGVSPRTIHNIIHNRHPHVKGSTAALLLATRPRPVTDRGRVPALGTVRRLQSLVAYGYSIEHIAHLTGLGMRHLFDLAAGRCTAVSIRVRNTVANVFEKHSTTPGPSDLARATGRKRGWHVPAAWDDIDDPNSRPQRGYTSRPDRLSKVLAGRVLRGEASIRILNDRERVELWRQWVAARVADGREPSVSAFARTFGLRWHTAAQIKTAAEDNTNPTPTASRATERTAS